jgi:hypothetical protein
MREDSPAAKITPAKLADRRMQRTIAENHKRRKSLGKMNHVGTAAFGCPVERRSTAADR